MVISVFDVDRTLIDGDCMLIAARHSNSKINFLLSFLKLLPWMFCWKLRLISTSRFKEQFLTNFDICETFNKKNDSCQRDWVLREIKQRLRPEAIHRLKCSKERGDRIVLCSASPRMLLQPLADYLGVELICTELKLTNRKWLPSLASPNCKGAEKVRRLEAHLGPLETLTIEAFGDSKGDKELLQAADLPHYRSFSREPRPYPMFSVVPLILIIAIVLVVYGLLGVLIEGDGLRTLITELSSEIIFGLGLILLSYGIRFFRWRLLLKALNFRPPLYTDIRIWMGSFAFTATPGKSGEAIRSILLRKYCKLPASSTLIALLIERLTDGIAVILLLSIYSISLQLHTELLPLLFIGFFILLGIFLSFLRFWNNEKLISALHGWIPKRFLKSGEGGFQAIRKLMRPSLLLYSSFIGALAWTLEGCSFWLLLNTLSGSAVSLGGVTIAHTTAGLIGALSMLPGGLGSTEAGTIGLLSLQGVALASATKATLLIRLMTLWFATFLGILCLVFPFKKVV